MELKVRSYILDLISAARYIGIHSMELKARSLQSYKRSSHLRIHSMELKDMYHRLYVGRVSSRIGIHSMELKVCEYSLLACYYLSLVYRIHSMELKGGRVGGLGVGEDSIGNPFNGIERLLLYV